MNFLFYFLCLNMFIILHDYKFCNCYESQEGGPVRLDGSSDEEEFQKGMDMYQRRERGQITEKTTSGYNEDEIEEEARKTAKILCIYGLSTDNMTRTELRHLVLKLFNDEMKVPIYQHEIISVSRMGSMRDPRLPIAVEFKTLEKKEEALRARFSLQGRPVTLESYMPRKLLEKQKALIPIMMKFRAAGRFCVIRHGKLILDGRVKFDAMKKDFDDALERFVNAYDVLKEPLQNFTKMVGLTFTTEPPYTTRLKLKPKKSKSKKKKKQKKPKIRDLNENRIEGLHSVSYENSETNKDDEDGDDIAE